jgi:hypothetical protein
MKASGGIIFRKTGLMSGRYFQSKVVRIFVACILFFSCCVQPQPVDQKTVVNIKTVLQGSAIKVTFENLQDHAVLVEWEPIFKRGAFTIEGATQHIKLLPHQKRQIKIDIPKSTTFKKVMILSIQKE